MTFEIQINLHTAFTFRGRVITTLHYTTLHYTTGYLFYVNNEKMSNKKGRAEICRENDKFCSRYTEFSVDSQILK